MAKFTKKTAQETNEVTITMTIKLTSIVKLPTNDEAKAQKATEAEIARIKKALVKLGVDQVLITDDKVFQNLAD